MKRIITIVMAGFFLAEASVWAQQATPIAKHRRTHTRPPYSGPMKAIDKGKVKQPHLPPKGKAKLQTGTEQVPTGQINVR
jgi:hypothetical protein